MVVETFMNTKLMRGEGHNLRTTATAQEVGLSGAVFERVKINSNGRVAFRFTEGCMTFFREEPR
jgi:hypothetical protein